MQTQYQTRAYVNSDYIKQSQTVQFAVMGEPYFVMKVTDTDIVLFGQSGIVTHQRGSGIYYTILKGEVEPIIMKNVNSGIAHSIKNGKSACGTVGAFSNMISTDVVTCKHCRENL